MIQTFLDAAYAGDLTGEARPARPLLAARILREHPELAAEPDVAWAIGEGREAPGRWPPLIAVTHSSLLRLPEFRDALHAAARRLLAAGADPNERVRDLSPLYGAAGLNRDGALVALLLEAGADPNDGESLYHALEYPAITAQLLRHGAVISGTNALRRALDLPDPAALELLLAHGADPNEKPPPGPTRPWRSVLLRAVALRKPAVFVRRLLQAGADPAVATEYGYDAAVLARLTGAADIAALLPPPRPLDAAERFVAACAAGEPGPAAPALPPGLARLLPDTVAWGNKAAAHVMVERGWPIAARGADWDATALNLAVFQGDAALARFLLEHGASWREPHGYGDDVLGTLSWASVFRPVLDGDWVGCAQALLAHGLPPGRRDPEDEERVLIDGRRARFAAEVAAALGD